LDAVSEFSSEFGAFLSFSVKSDSKAVRELALLEPPYRLAVAIFRDSMRAGAMEEVSPEVEVIRVRERGKVQGVPFFAVETQMYVPAQKYFKGLYRVKLL
jgi:hypothetical protein